MQATLKCGHAGTYLLVAEDGRDILFQSDWDFPGLASSFGWIPCFCGKTDGTVDCEHRTATKMIVDSQNFLDSHEGESIDASDYFLE